ncbi:hypothetical protein AHiyo4_11190 [Arthrobacter sp. Hiyo4]|nr:hypothetical protein AHiyo4_11190 [Arthrobacter sp. Hiyo4]
MVIPRNAASITRDSLRLMPISRRTPAGSAIAAAAAMTMAARVVAGRNSVTPGAASMKPSTRTAPATPVSWDFAPASTATGVRDVLAEIGNPPSSPLAAFAAPRAAISWLPDTFSSSAVARDWDRVPVSTKTIRAMAAAAAAVPGRRPSRFRREPVRGAPAGGLR